VYAKNYEDRLKMFSVIDENLAGIFETRWYSCTPLEKWNIREPVYDILAPGFDGGVVEGITSWSGLEHDSVDVCRCHHVDIVDQL